MVFGVETSKGASKWQDVRRQKGEPDAAGVLRWVWNVDYFGLGVLFVIVGGWVLDQVLTDGTRKRLPSGYWSESQSRSSAVFATQRGSRQERLGRTSCAVRFVCLLGCSAHPLIVSGSLMFVACFVLEQGSGVHEVAGLGATAVGSIVAGVLFLRAARTGRDPYIRGSGPS